MSKKEKERIKIHIRTSIQGADQGEILTTAGSFYRTLPFVEKMTDPKSPKRNGKYIPEKKTYLIKECLANEQPCFLDRYSSGLSVRTSKRQEAFSFRNQDPDDDE